MINVNQRIFAKDKKEFSALVDTNTPGLMGFYKTLKNGIRFMDKEGNPFLFLCRNNPSHPFFVSCSSIESAGKQKIRYLFSTTSIDEKKLGFDSVSYRQLIDLCLNIKEESIA